MSERDDETWRAIVDNYGERPALDPDLDPEPNSALDLGEEPDDGPLARSEPRALDVPPELRSWTEESVDSDWTTDRFVPPPPPPIPTPPRDRLVAWLGIFGSPVILLVCLVLGIVIPQLIAYVLVAGFVGGFVYLVAKMPREPRDPGDDGAVL